MGQAILFYMYISLASSPFKGIRKGLVSRLCKFRSKGVGLKMT